VSGGRGEPRTVSVAVPVGLDRAFTYAVPADWPEAPPPGTRVLVPLGQRGVVGVVRDVAGEAPAGGAPRLRPLEEAIDPPGAPSLTPGLVRLCEWVQDYYVAPVGEVYRLALPGLLTGSDVRKARLTPAGAEALASARAFVLTSDGGGPYVPSVAEQRVLAALATAPKQELAVERLTSLRPRIAGVLRLLGELAARGLCEISWDEAEDEGARVEVHYRRTDYLRGSAGDEDKLQKLVGRSKQRRALLDALETAPPGAWLPAGELRGPFPRLRELVAALVESGLVVAEERPRALDPFALGAPETSAPQAPTADQERALAALRADVDAGAFAASLLHGVTGSGKTEVYLQLIAHARAHGGGAIVLVPEIALTPQLSDRFRARFGDTVAVLHSGLTPRQRLDAWQQIRGGLRTIVIGARSAVFAPVVDLRVIVVDEEHDPSFKQEEGVRYNARDVALVRARDERAVAVLGSATPALETYEAARGGRYRWLRLESRPTPRPLPDVELVALSVHRPDPDTLLTGRMRAALTETVAAGEQAILFLNRRGFATTLVCGTCGSLHACPDCSAPSMTYHLQRNRLMCHLCGRIEAPPERCRTCERGELLHGSAGTERVELAVTKEIPQARVLRLDRDTSRGKGLLDTLARFRNREADVLVGTQMLSKGHDFPGVTLVGILQADHGLGMPDLRAAERTFQLLTQVAGRAGRGDRAGRVLVQAYAVTHPAVARAARHDYAGFAASELENRQQLGNPPFGFLALVRVSGPDAVAVRRRAEALGGLCRARVEAARKHAPEGERPPLALLGPVPSPIERVNRRVRWQLLVRAGARQPLRWLLKQLRPQLGLDGSGDFRTHAIVDVDPQSLL
jgi:primosomal protein N' (replication factor Y)